MSFMCNVLVNTHKRPFLSLNTIRELEKRLGVVVDELEGKVRQLSEKEKDSKDENGEGNERERRRFYRGSFSLFVFF